MEEFVAHIWVLSGAPGRPLVRADTITYLSSDGKTVTAARLESAETVPLVSKGSKPSLPEDFHLALVSTLTKARAVLANEDEDEDEDLVLVAECGTTGRWRWRVHLASEIAPGQP
jgi:hypothetical protein